MIRVILSLFLAVLIPGLAAGQTCPPGGRCCPPGLLAPQGYRFDVPRRGAAILPPNQGAVVVDRGIRGNRVFVPQPSQPAAVVPRPFVCQVWISSDPRPASGVLVYRGPEYALVATARHVPAAYVIRFPDRSEHQVREGFHDKLGYDSALLRIDTAPVEPVPFGQSPQVGQRVTIVGYPLGRYGEHAGLLLGFCAPESGQRYGDIQVGTPSQDGDSGGAMLDDQGRLVGILWGTASDGSANSVGVPIEAVAEFVLRVRARIDGRIVAPAPPPAPAPLPIPDPTPENPVVVTHSYLAGELVPILRQLDDCEERIGKLEAGGSGSVDLKPITDELDRLKKEQAAQKKTMDALDVKVGDAELAGQRATAAAELATNESAAVKRVADNLDRTLKSIDLRLQRFEQSPASTIQTSGKMRFRLHFDSAGNVVRAEPLFKE